jgi:hypothetical protein
MQLGSDGELPVNLDAAAAAAAAVVVTTASCAASSSDVSGSCSTKRSRSSNSEVALELLFVLHAEQQAVPSAALPAEDV